MQFNSDEKNQKTIKVSDGNSIIGFIFRWNL